MSIVITNVSGRERYGKGTQKYEIKIGTKVLASYEHEFEDGLAVCLQKAAEACKDLPFPGSWEGKRNRIRCLKCRDVIEARHQHDFKSCKCGFVSIDGGFEGHWRRLWQGGDHKEAFEELP